MKFYNDLKGKNILVVGGSSGIGKSLIKSLIAVGSNLEIASSKVDSILEQYKNLPDQITTYQCDFNDNKQILELSKSVNLLDGVAFVSGKTKVVPPHLLTEKIVLDQLDFNLSKPLVILSALLRSRKINSPASIVFTSASARINQVPCTAPYAAAKLGLYGACRSLSADLSKKFMRVNCVSFDYVDTSMISSIDTKNTVDVTIGISPVEYTNMPYLFLLSNKSRWMTGQMLAADAGRMLGKTRYV